MRFLVKIGFVLILLILSISITLPLNGDPRAQNHYNDYAFRSDTVIAWPKQFRDQVFHYAEYWKKHGRKGILKSKVRCESLPSLLARPISQEDSVLDCDYLEIPWLRTVDDSLAKESPFNAVGRVFSFFVKRNEINDTILYYKRGSAWAIELEGSENRYLITAGHSLLGLDKVTQKPFWPNFVVFSPACDRESLYFISNIWSFGKMHNYPRGKHEFDVLGLKSTKIFNKHIEPIKYQEPLHDINVQDHIVGLGIPYCWQRSQKPYEDWINSDTFRITGDDACRKEIRPRRILQRHYVMESWLGPGASGGPILRHDPTDSTWSAISINGWHDRTLENRRVCPWVYKDAMIELFERMKNDR